MEKAKMPEKRGRGQPPHKPTEKTRAEVLALSSYGTPQEDIARYIGISRDTLAKWYEKELTEATVRANANVARTLYQQAIAGNTTAMIFWLKTRARWRETHHLDHTSSDGSMTSPRIIEVVAGGGNGGSGEG